MVSLNADGDGIPDLAVGSPGQVVAGVFGAGAVRIYSGADGSLITTALGSGSSQLGTSLANAGDQNGDGIDDLYAGAPYANSSRGVVFVLSGADGSVLRQFTTTASTSSFGVTLVTLGDVDGDGRADVAVGAPGLRVSGNPVGRVVLVRSSDNAVAAQITGSGVFNRLGESLAGSDDVNGDGLPDLLVGSYSGGTARVVSGADFSTLRDLSIPTLPAYRQLTVGGGLDFDGDGVMDFLIGSPALQVTGTQQLGGIRVVSGLDSSTLFEYTATKPYTGLGLSLKVLPGLGMAAGETSLQDPVTLGYGMAHVWEVNPIRDTDGDGVLDDVDLNPNSIMTPSVVILGEDSLVPNRVDEQGVSLADRFAELGAVTDYPRPALYYVKVLQFTKDLENGGTLSKDESRQITAAAVKGLVKTNQSRR